MKKQVGAVALVLLVLSFVVVQLTSRSTAPKVTPPPAGGTRTLVATGGVFVPSILYDESMGTLRLWHHSAGTKGRIDVVHRQSSDGTNWTAPTVVHSGDDWGTNVVRDGGTYRWLAYGIRPADLENQGIYTYVSSDGVTWSPPNGPVLRLSDGVGDIVDFFHDPIRNRWRAFVKMFAQPREFGDDPKLAGVRRLTGATESHDFKAWAPPTRVFVPDAQDEGVIEFYGAACCLVRDARLVAFLRVLRDDVGEGVGYTVLAWSDDGSTWQRARQPFFDRCPGAFDGAMAWIYGVTEHNGTIYFSYSAYAQGHKVGERSVGLAMMASSTLNVPDGHGPGCTQ